MPPSGSGIAGSASTADACSTAATSFGSTPRSRASAAARSAIAPASRRAPAAAATNVPRPCWELIRSCSSSSRYTARAVLTLTPAKSASSRTLGTRSPGRRTPRAIIERIFQPSWVPTGSSDSRATAKSTPVARSSSSGVKGSSASVTAAVSLGACCATVPAQYHHHSDSQVAQSPTCGTRRSRRLRAVPGRRRRAPWRGRRGYRAGRSRHRPTGARSSRSGCPDARTARATPP